MNEIDSKIQKHLNRFRSIPLPELEAQTARKRLDWADAFLAANPAPERTLRAAYEFLFSAYMGLDLADLPVIEETPERIVWLSRNTCPTHAACVEGGLDTRRICRAVYERSTQALVSRLDPELRFARSYVEIRPYAPHCREGLVRMDFAAALAELDAAARDCAGAALIFPGEGVDDGVVDDGVRGRGVGEDTAIAFEAALRESGYTPGTLDLYGCVLFLNRVPQPALLDAVGATGVTSVVYPDPDGAPGAWVEILPAFPDAVNRPRR